MPKTRSRKYQEQVTWKAFATYVKMRDAIRSTGTLAEVDCFTCGVRIPRGASQAGHIVSRTYQGALYNEKVVFAQCQHCNYNREGNHILGFFHLVDMVGYDRACSIIFDSMRPKPLTMEDLEDIEEGCNNACEIMEKYYEQYAI
jgi:hypothetical protein